MATIHGENVVAMGNAVAGCEAPAEAFQHNDSDGLEARLIFMPRFEDCFERKGLPREFGRPLPVTRGGSTKFPSRP